MLDNPYAVEELPTQDIDLIIPTRVAELDSNIRLAKEAIATMESRPCVWEMVINETRHILPVKRLLPLLL
jgi:hypothetical protein